MRMSLVYGGPVSLGDARDVLQWEGAVVIASSLGPEQGSEGYRVEAG